MRPIVVDLFSGVGGFSLGFEAAGFDIGAAVEIDPVHAAAHQFNFPGCKTICQDIKNLHPSRIAVANEIDCLIFGSPCQAFSVQGVQDPNDPRATLGLEALRMILALRPKYFVMENVPAILLAKNKHILQDLIDKFAQGGYEVVRPFQSLNAKGFGVPQNRDRLFVLGYRLDCPPPRYPEKENTISTVGDFIFDLAGVTEFVGKDLGIDAQVLNNHTILSGTNIRDRFSQCHVRQGRERIWGHLGSKHSEKVKERFALTQHGKTEPISRFHKLAVDRLCPTLVAGTPASKGSHTAKRPIHFKYPRCITIREAARLHGYPDWFQFSRTIWSGMRQVGNSVCPPVAQAIAKEIIKVLGAKPSQPKLLPRLDEELLSFGNIQAAEYFATDPKLNGGRVKKTLKLKAITLK